MLKHRVFTLLTLGSGLLLSASQGFADGKNYAGVHCFRDPDAANNATASDLSYFAGTVANKSSSLFLNVICPFVHDTGQITGATVHVFDRHSTGQIVCTIYADIYGSAASPLTWASNSGASGLATNQPQIATFSIAGVTSSTAGAATYAKCAIPPIGSGGNSHLGKIDVVEGP